MKNSWKYLLLFLFLQACNASSGDYSVEKADKLFSLLSPKKTGVLFQNTLVEDAKHNHLLNDMFVAGAGVAVGDINQDGLPDLYFAGNQVPDRLYLNKGGFQFEDVTEAAGIEADKNWSTGVTMADVNNDGLLDIYVCKMVQENEQLSANLFYINEGDGTFSEKGLAYNLADRGLSVQATFADFDKDGYLDMYLVNQPPSLGKRQGNTYNRLNLKTLKYSDRLYWNKPGTQNAPPHFKDVTTEAGLLNLGYGLSATVGDFNNDGWPDIYVSNDFDRPDHLYFNKKDGTFENAANRALKHMSNFSMGTDVADYDNDGLLDILSVDMVAEDHKRIKTYMGGMKPENFWKIVNNGWHYQYMFNALQKNNGNETFSEVAQLAGVSNTDWSWGPLFADFDNDGWKDVFVTNGIKRNQRFTDLDKLISRKLDSLELVAQKKGKPLRELIDVMDFVKMVPLDKLNNYIFKNGGDLTFSNKIQDWGMASKSLSYGAAYADLDGDGDLDLIVNNVDDFASIYRNNSREQQGSNYLKIRVLNKNGSPAYGARVRLFKKEKLWQFMEISNARGYMSKSEDLLHFGLGDVEKVNELEVVWPSGKRLRLEGIQANQTIEVDPSQAKEKVAAKQSPPKLFKEVTSRLKLNYRHWENSFNDYKKQVLLPHKMSNFGPGLAVGDANADGLEDFYVGGASGFLGALFFQKADGTFAQSKQSAWTGDQICEDLGATFFDADSDGDLDLYVVSGGNEFNENDPALQDRLYLNKGRGKFEKAENRLPEIRTSGSQVLPADFDQDGDVDLFVGGRLVPGKYPFPASSFILQNEGGYFKNVTKKIAPGLINLGLVTDAVWTDFNGDGALDLVVVGEWMPVTLFENKNGRFQNTTATAGLSNSAGWYYGIVAADFDGDGDPDLVAGNLGLNYKYKASPEAPFEVFCDDFDENGQPDIVLSYYEHGEQFPLRGRSCSSEQIPALAEKFPTYESFGDANLREMYGNELDQALHYQAKTFATSYLENLGNGKFKSRPLPNEAQFSSVNNLIARDFNRDGHLDLLISGNLYASEIETPRNDAGMGLFLAGNGNGNFEPIPLLKSGFFAPHDAKDMKMLSLGKKKTPVILVANNNFRLQAIQSNQEGSEDFN